MTSVTVPPRSIQNSQLPVPGWHQETFADLAGLFLPCQAGK
jgi:hypothetical protein